jgi:hypothetical protein
MKIIVLCLFFCSFCSVYAGISDVFPRIGCEKEVVKDETTGRTITYLTSGEFMNCHFYPHNKTWAENDRYILIESSRPAPGSSRNECKPEFFTGERQLLAADVSTGDLYHLATLEHESDASEKYGKYHFTMSSQYHADYAPGHNLVVYYDMTGHNLYLLSLDTGRKKLLWHVDKGTIGDPPTICNSGERVVVYMDMPGASDYDFTGRTSYAFYIDVDPVELTMKGRPEVITVLADRWLAPEKQTGGRRSMLNLSHALINPADKSEMSYSRGFGIADGSVEMSRIWYAKVDGSLLKPANITEKGHIYTHDLWSPDGKYIYYVDICGTGGVSKVDPRTGETTVIFKDTNPRCLHVSVSMDERYIVFDTQVSHGIKPIDKYKNHLEDLVLYDVNEKKFTLLATVNEGLNHPRHIHPQINYAGTKVAFTEADGYNSRVAFVKLDK